MNHKISTQDVLVFSTVLKGTGDSNLVASFRCLKLGEVYPGPCVSVLHVFRTGVILGSVSEVMWNQICASFCHSCNSCEVGHKYH